MSNFLDNAREALATAVPGFGQATKALQTANTNNATAASNAQLKSYQDKYGPNIGQQLYQQDQAKASSAGQGHMGDWADKMHPTNK